MEMICWVYRSPRKADMYLYLAKEDDFDQVPEELIKRFGTPVQIMSLELHANRKLAREDINKVIENLESQGYHLQMPPSLTPDLYYGNDM